MREIQWAIHRQPSQSFFFVLAFGVALLSGAGAIWRGDPILGAGAAALGLLGASFLAWPATRRWRLARWRRRAGLENGPIQVTVEPHGITTRSAWGSSHLAWSAFAGALDLPSGVFLPLRIPGSRQDGLWIPCKAEPACRTLLHDKLAARQRA